MSKAFGHFVVLSMGAWHAGTALSGQKNAQAGTEFVFECPTLWLCVVKCRFVKNINRKDWYVRIAAREASKYCKLANKRITIAKHRTNRTDHHRMAKHKQPITSTKTIQQSYQKGSVNNHRATSNGKHKANANRNHRKKNAEQKAKHNRKRKSKTTIANQNETKLGSRISKF